jgi:hypothetical protein
MSQPNLFPLDEHECRTDGAYEPCNFCGLPWEEIDE